MLSRDNVGRKELRADNREVTGFRDFVFAQFGQNW